MNIRHWLTCQSITSNTIPVIRNKENTKLVLAHSQYCCDQIKSHPWPFNLKTLLVKHVTSYSAHMTYKLFLCYNTTAQSPLRAMTCQLTAGLMLTSQEDWNKCSYCQYRSDMSLVQQTSNFCWLYRSQLPLQIIAIQFCYDAVLIPIPHTGWKFIHTGDRKGAASLEWVQGNTP